VDVFEEFSKEKLIDILRDFAANWLAHDGTWFQAAEAEYGMETAIHLDTEAWRRFSPIEAKRIMKRHGIEPGGGLEALKKALFLRMYSRLNVQEVAEETEKSFVFRMNDCRVQSARKRRGLPDFPCKSVGVVEYSTFAETIDKRLRTECIACPPDAHPDEYYCAWRFTIE
jgi:hypothetical protein